MRTPDIPPHWEMLFRSMIVSKAYTEGEAREVIERLEDNKKLGRMGKIEWKITREIRDDIINAVKKKIFSNFKRQ